MTGIDLASVYGGSAAPSHCVASTGLSAVAGYLGASSVARLAGLKWPGAVAMGLVFETAAIVGATWLTPSCKNSALQER